ncbi:Opticin [Camelus dromedarius]|uniref:Opticin n=1 Tax=Camelus dromedarius TaxID=9838 RepID=A0A5N4CJL1_CAMDR|nr:Opticin [Camelus dromedarius]
MHECVCAKMEKPAFARPAMKPPAFLSLLVLMLQGAASLPEEERGSREGQLGGEGDSDTALRLGDGVLANLSHYDEPADSEDQLPKTVFRQRDQPGFFNWDEFCSEHEGSRDSPFKPHSGQAHCAGPAGTPDQPRCVHGHRPPYPRVVGHIAVTQHQGTKEEWSLPTCLVCVCLGSSVYCDDIDLESIPPLPQTTAYLYARFNRISRIRAGDFRGLTKLKRIDLSSNLISSIEDDALRLLPALKGLILPENQLAALPALPAAIEVLDVRRNRLQSSGIQPEAFRALEKLPFLYLADNLLDSIPRPLPLSLRSLHLQNNLIETMQRDTFCDPEEHKHTRRRLEDIRLDGNPINLSLFASAYFCLPRLPVGRFT